MRIGVLSPNLIDSIEQANALHVDQNAPWMFDEIAKKVSLLFDKIYLTDDLDVTFDIIGNCIPEERIETLRYLQEKGLLFVPADLGFESFDAFKKSAIKGNTAKVHRALMRIGNPGIGEPDDYKNVGHPDVGDYAAQNGMHPRSNKGWNDPAIKARKIKYENLLLQRNAMMLREAGAEVEIVGRTIQEGRASRDHHPIWSVLFSKMPQLDRRAPWEDVFDFRKEERTQHLVRSLRRWIRKMVSEDWKAGELEDEVGELIYEYEAHLRHSRINGATEIFEFVITGTTELMEDIVKLRFAKIAKTATAILNRRTKWLQGELSTPGRELALIPAMRERF